MRIGGLQKMADSGKWRTMGKGGLWERADYENWRTMENGGQGKIVK